MKFMTMSVYPVAKAAEVAAASDKVWAGRSQEGQPPSAYVLMTVPFPVPPNSLVVVTIGESESAEEMAARVYPLMVAGATVDIIPVLEVPLGAGAEFENRGCIFDRERRFEL